MTLHVIYFVETATVKSKLERPRFARNRQRQLSATTEIGICLMSNHGRDVNHSFSGIYKYLPQMIRVLLLCSPFTDFFISTERQTCRTTRYPNHNIASQFALLQCISLSAPPFPSSPSFPPLSPPSKALAASAAKSSHPPMRTQFPRTNLSYPKTSLTT